MKFSDFHEIGSLSLHLFSSLPDLLKLLHCDFEGRFSDQTRFVISFQTKEIYLVLIPARVL